MLVLLIYAVWVLVQLPASRGALLFTDVGTAFLRHSHASPTIGAIPELAADPRFAGYDGQFAYYMALDPLKARYYMDEAPYRYTRIIYPLLARVLALGRADLIPYALLAVNVLAIGAGTFFVAAWLKRKSVSPWYALIYGFYPGLFVALRFDLTEALAYGLVAAAMYAFQFGGRRRLLLAGTLFSLATLTRESSSFFGLLYGISLLPWRARSLQHIRMEWTAILRGLTFLSVVFVPFACYKVVLYHAFGNAGYDASLAPTLSPFKGLLAWYPWLPIQMEQIRSIVFPGIFCLGMAVLYFFRRGRNTVHVWLLVVNVVLFVICLNAKSYQWFPDAVRIATGVPLAALFALPDLDRVTGGKRLWLLASAMLWLWPLPAWLMTPINHYLYLT